MRLLLDSHLASAIAAQLKRLDVDAVTLAEWQDGRFRTASDEVILIAAQADRRVFVTADCRTIPPLLKEFAESYRAHSGVILVDRRTFRPSDVGGLVRSLQQLCQRSGTENWEDRVVFLTK